MKYCLIRERSLVMPRRGLEEISKGHKNFLGLMGGGGGGCKILLYKKIFISPLSHGFFLFNSNPLPSKITLHFLLLFYRPSLSLEFPVTFSGTKKIIPLFKIFSLQTALIAIEYLLL